MLLQKKSRALCIDIDNKNLNICVDLDLLKLYDIISEISFIIKKYIDFSILLEPPGTHRYDNFFSDDWAGDLVPG